MKTIRLFASIVLALVLLAAAVSPADAGGPRNFRAHLNGEDAGIDETLAQGQAIFQFSKDGTELYYRLIVANIEGVIMAHIHLYTDEAGGPPVLWLIPDAPPPLSPLGRTDGVLVEGTVDASRLVGPLKGMSLADLREAMADGNTYVNVHTEDHPGGEIRGDIH